MASAQENRPLTWLITGCSSGFGLAFARHALASGQHVIATSRAPQRTPELVAEIEAGGGRWLALDVDAPDCGRVVGQLEDAGTPVDVLVNSAGVARCGPLDGFAEAEIRGLMETNFFGPYRLMRAAVPHMRRRRRGLVVNLSSGSGLGARPGLGGYGACKAALDAVSKTLAQEVAEFGVRILLVYMGAFNTPMAQSVRLVSRPLDADYGGTAVARTARAFSERSLQPAGDHEKAVKAIYDVALGQGVGKGLEKETQMVLGRDCAVRVGEVRDDLDHMMTVFGDVCNNVDMDP